MFVILLSRLTLCNGFILGSKNDKVGLLAEVHIEGEIEYTLAMFGIAFPVPR